MRELETKEEFDEFIEENKDKLVVIDFHAEWCGPCKMIGPKFEAMKDDFPAAVFAKVDVDENEDVAEEYDIQAMPTFLVFKSGSKVDSMTGANKDTLRSTIEKHYE